jgi:PadR family transcriptional regulator, regulatory protein AphA
MDIKYALLGFLSWQPFSGYDLKKMLENSEMFYWSGNNNQVYTGLVQLHKDGLVESEAQPSEKMPNRKVYRITPAGLAELRQWLLSEPEMPQFRKPALIQLAWSGELTASQTAGLLEKYEYELQMRVVLLKEQLKRGTNLNPDRTTREHYLWQRIFEHYLGSYTFELDWVRQTRRELSHFPD